MKQLITHLITLPLIASTIILSSCATINYNASEEQLTTTAVNDIQLESTQTWQAKTAYADTSKDVDTQQIDYWTSALNDPRLEYYINLALDQNRDLRVEAANLAAAFERTRITASLLKPTVNGNLANQYTTFNDSRSTTRNYDYSIDISWEVDIWSRLSDQYKASVLSAESLQATYKAARLSLTANVARQWFLINADHLRIAIGEMQLLSQKNTLTILEERFKSGGGGAMDIFLGRSAVASQQSFILDIKNQREQSIRTFKRLLGHYPNIDLLFESFLPELTSSVPAGLPSELLLRRPDIISSMKAWQSSILDISVADKARYPSFSLTSSYGTSSDELLKINANDLALNLIGNLTTPIFQGGRLNADLKEAKHLADALYQNYISTLLVSFEEVESALAAEGYLKGQLAATNEAANSAGSGYQLAFEQYQAGLISFTNLLEFERQWFSSQLDTITLQNAVLQNRINLSVALGGDFYP